jgi:hypothetical protein
MPSIGETTFYEKINLSKLNYILNTISTYEKDIQDEIKDMKKNNPNYNIETVLLKIKEAVVVPKQFEDTEYGLIKVKYQKGRKSNGIGRWYCVKGVGVQMLVGSIRATICEGLWYDIDQVNSHPTILKQLFAKYGYTSALLNEYVEDRENVLKTIMKEEKCGRGDAKNKIIAIINGGGAHGAYTKAFKQEVMPLIEKVIEKEEFADIYKVVFDSETPNKVGKACSKVLQFIESDMLECYIQKSIENGVVVKYEDGYMVSCIFDGYQVLVNENVNDEYLQKCREYAFVKTGYDVKLVIKPFDTVLKLPEDYADRADSDVSLFVDKYLNKLDAVMTKSMHYIERAYCDKGTHAGLSELCKHILKNTVVYDDEADLWFHCDNHNVWHKRKTPVVIKSFAKSVLVKLFLKLNEMFYNMACNAKEEDEIKKYQNKAKLNQEVALKIRTNGCLKAIADVAMIDFNQNGFYENKLDSKGHLFAFTNKVLDCRAGVVRDIMPNDYILITTGYKYPEVVDEKAKKVIEDYYKTIYPDEGVRGYMWNSDSLLLNGERIFQSFNIHTGSGCNSKSTKFALLEKVLGDYCVKVNAETFTQKPKGANATSELYKAKGARMLLVNEPESDADNKLQVSQMKQVADGHKSTIKTRGLYMDAIEFNIFFRVEIACNNKPALSSVDGGIARRLRVIDYPVKFVENPEPGNINQQKLDNEMVITLTTDEVRDTLALMLIKHFIDVSKHLKTEGVPEKIEMAGLEYIAESDIVLGFIMEKYVLTNNDSDRVKSSVLFADYVRTTGDKNKTASVFKADMLRISGVSFDRNYKGSFFCGLRLGGVDYEGEDN